MKNELLKQRFPYLTATDIDVIASEADNCGADALLEIAAAMNAFRQNVYNDNVYFQNLENVKLFSKVNSPEHQWMLSCLIYYLFNRLRPYPETGLYKLGVTTTEQNYEPDLIVFERDAPAYMIEIEHNKDNRIIGGTRKKAEDCLKTVDKLKYVYIIRIKDNDILFHKLSRDNYDTRKSSRELPGNDGIDREIMQAVAKYRQSVVHYGNHNIRSCFNFIQKFY